MVVVRALHAFPVPDQALAQVRGLADVEDGRGAPWVGEHRPGCADHVGAGCLRELVFFAIVAEEVDESVVPAPVLKTETQVEVPNSATPLVLVRSAWGAPKSVGSNGETVFRLKGERAFEVDVWTFNRRCRLL